ncbi:hypothetical protein [Pseudooctadecabacter jejudonensis]|uniref:Uncharacterized protein n=1 Tax=Pseudooctadecabacter jejudonensis TaxID=1391910 RepID=A0A1Y5RKD8_9RHOB|nr:hypothetical protein [Pseudooctadecabacter jejudonensis]SLN19360.1 hypothetical protein PSJ8397_00678 [Pseudooctadecabacter jejudonensis]
MRSALTLPLIGAAALLPNGAAAHATTYFCDTRRDVCAAEGACERIAFDMSFVVDDLTNSAAMIKDDQFTVLTPTGPATNPLTFDLFGQTFRFREGLFGNLSVSIDMMINDQPAVADFTCQAAR